MTKENSNITNFFLGSTIYHIGIFYAISKLPYRYQQQTSLTAVTLSLGTYYMFVFKNRKDNKFSPFKF